MGTMLLSDRGRVMRTHNEELTRWRWARKTFDVPAKAAGAPADLWVYAAPYVNTRALLEVHLNGKKLSAIKPIIERKDMWSWYKVAVKSVPAGRVEIMLSAETPAMNAWRLGIDNTSTPHHSALSFDRGKTWQSESMGAHQSLRGEYVIRLRCHSERVRELKPPAIVYEDLKHPRLRGLKAMVPAAIGRQRDPWKQLLALRTWVATRWTHDPFGAAYCPWDAPTILDWTKRGGGHGQKSKVAMCVHFANVFAQFAAALGHRSRCNAITGKINTMSGHFVTEVFDKKSGRWIMHDPNYDSHFETDVPLGIVDIADIALAGERLDKMTRFGPGRPDRPARLMRGFRMHFGPGTSYRNVSVWRLNNLVSNPAGMPPNHGSVSYCETDFVWYNPKGHDVAPMFPYRVADRRWFTDPPD